MVSQNKSKNTTVNYVTGSIAIVIATLIGMVVWFLSFLAGMSILSGVVGLVMFMLGILGFRLFGKRITLLSIGINSLFSGIGIYFANRITYALGIMWENSYTFSKSYSGMAEFMVDSPEFAYVYWLTMIVGYIALGIGLLGTIIWYVWKRIKAKKMAHA